MPLTWLFHDSEVMVVQAGVDVVLRLSAAHALSPATGPHHGTPGFIQALTVVCKSAQVLQLEEGCIGRVIGGRLFMGHQAVNQLPIPIEIREPVRLELQFGHGSSCIIQAQGLSIQLPADARFIESMAC
jgi:hypothetical protein